VGRAVLTSYLSPVGNAPAVPPEEHYLGPAPTSTPLGIEVVLQPRDPAALSAFATAVSTPGNRLYQHFLAQGQFAAKFGPTPAAIAAVTGYLREAGLVPGVISADHLSIPVQTTVGRVDGAFHVAMNLYRQPAGAGQADAVVNTSTPRLPASLAGYVQGILGLDTVSTPVARPIPARPHPRTGRVASVPAAKGPKACSQAVSVANRFGGWTENQLAQAYSFDGIYAKGDLGSGATIALFEEQTYSSKDIADFQHCYGTHLAISNISVDGGSKKDSDFSPEAALDIETVIGLAPKAALRVYETIGNNNGPIDGYRDIVTQDKAQVISSSWSTAPFNCDLFVSTSLKNAENTVFQEAAAQGQSTFVANGDVGSEGCMSNGGSLEIQTGTIGPDAIAVDPSTSTVYVANFSAGSVSVVSEKEIFSFNVPLGAGTEPDGIAVDPKTHQVWISEDGKGRVAEIHGTTCNASNNSKSGCKPSVVAGSTFTDSAPASIAVDPSTGTAYVAYTGAGGIGVVKESMSTFVDDLPTGTNSDPFGVAVDVSADEVFLTSLSFHEFGDFDGATCNATVTSGCAAGVTGSGPVGSGPYGIAFNPATGQLYVANSGSDTLTVLTPSTTSTVGLASSGLLSPTSVAVAPGGSSILVTAIGGAKGKDAGTAVISTHSLKVTRVISGGSAPIAVATDANLGYGWVADNGLATGGAATNAVRLNSGQASPKSHTRGAATPVPGGIIWMPLVLSVEDPSGQPYVTGVGGTNLVKLGPAPKETVWNEPALGEGAGTGGISSQWTMPKYQSGPGVLSKYSSAKPCHATGGKVCRELPDVSASADPAHGYVIVFGGSWTVVGGTSAATPLWAALTALLDVYRGKMHRLGFLNPSLYKLASEGKPIVNDVTVGNNDYTTSNGGFYPTTKRYDMATGLGTPIGTGLAKALG
jgi:DNA-binding beta-propeller fold protein YncE